MSDEEYAPLYHKIYADIRKQIETNILRPGDKIPTEFELMEQYGVSRITASRAAKDLARDGYVTRLRKNGSIVNERPVSQQTAEPSGSPNTFELLPLVMPFAPDSGLNFVGGIQPEAFSKRFMLTLYNSQKDLKTEREILEVLEMLDIGGLLCFPIESYDNLPNYVRLLMKKIPIVFLDRTLPGLDIPYVGTDNLHAMYQLTSYVIEMGHRDIAFYCYSLSITNENMRFKGYLKALIDHGIQPRNEYIYELSKYEGQSTMLLDDSQLSAQATGVVLEQIMRQPKPPSVMMCCNDLLASYVQKQASLLEISIPEQLSLTGFDNLNICEHMEIPLTSVQQSYEQIGSKAVELLTMIKSGQNVEPVHLFNGTIIHRSSVMKKNKG